MRRGWGRERWRNIRIISVESIFSPLAFFSFAPMFRFRGDLAAGEPLCSYFTASCAIKNTISRVTASQPRTSFSAASLTSSRICSTRLTRSSLVSSPVSLWLSFFFRLYPLFVNRRTYSKPKAFGYSVRFRKLQFRISGYSFVIPLMIAENSHASLAINITDNLLFNLRYKDLNECAVDDGPKIELFLNEFYLIS